MKKHAYMNPYVAGVLLGLIVVLSIYLSGRGIGASGAFKSVIVSVSHEIAPDHTNANHFLSKYVSDKTSPLKSWLVFEVLGVVIGGFLSGLLANRLTLKIDKGPRISNKKRLIFAFIGGALFAIGAQYARGCTSGAALSGMSILSSSGFIVMIAIFGSGFAFAYLFRKLWN